MLNIKDNVLSLLSLYNKDESKKAECVDRLFILVYYHRTSFGLSITDDEASDFLASIYPKGIESFFEKYDESKANFYTFICACLKYKCDFFLQNKLKGKNKLNVLIEQVKSDALLENTSLEETSLESTSLESTSLENTPCYTPSLETNMQNYQNKEYAKICAWGQFKRHEKKMQEMLLQWFNNNSKRGDKKGERRLVFILLCKAAPFVDDDMLQEISSYLELSFEVSRYYVDIFRCEFMKCNKKMLEAKARRDKYYIKRLTSIRLLRLENNTEYSEGIIKRGLKYSIKKHKNASLEVKKKVKSVSNRRISYITGISRSSIDRICKKGMLEE